MTDSPATHETAADLDTDFSGLDETESSALVFKPKPTAKQLTPWMAEDYAPIVRRSGAVKLASSGVAPLVVAARGYESVVEEQSKDFAKRWGIGDGRSKRGQQFLASFRDGGDVLIMPWFSVDQQVLAEEDLVKISTSNLQMRPQNPRKNEKNKVVKYEFLVGSDTVLDYHPSVTRGWASSAPRVLLAEGLLKGDSTLTAMLRAHVGDEELALTERDSDRLYAMRRLARLLDTIPAHERVGIVSLAGVGNWKSNPEWAEVHMREKDVYVAFDGDVTKNWNVWNMANQLFHLIEGPKHGKGHLLLLERNDEANRSIYLDGEPHLGLDDFFHHVGDWSDFDSMVTDEFPPKPARPEERNAGEWRVSSDGNSVEECVYVDGENKDSGVRWELRYDIGGKILFSETLRRPTDEELLTAEFGNGVYEEDYAVRATVEVKWHDEVTKRDIAVHVTGPHTFLGYPPNEWDKRGASIPKALMFHKQWPPKKGLEWLGAIKGSTEGTIEDRTTWSTMGYVPVMDSRTPAFIAGDVIVALDEEAKKGIRAGVTDTELKGSRKFGVSDVYTGPDFTDPTGEFNLVDDIRAILDAFVGTQCPWKTKEAAATILSMALRPSVPLGTKIASYFVGPPQMGKSWTARMVMSFWQIAPGAFKDALPGSANDTFTSIENAVSRTPIWVIDDMAPSPDRRKAEIMYTAVGDLIRAVHNKLGKRRSNADLTAKEVPTPMSLAIFTAENEHPIQSIRERVVNIEFNGLREEGMENMLTIANTSLTASRVNAAVIRMFLLRGERDGWEATVQHVKEMQENNENESRAVLESAGVVTGIERPMGIAADVSLGLGALGMLAAELGMTEVAEKFDWSEDGYMRLVAMQISLSNQNKEETAPGRVLLDCIANLLSSGVGHIANLDDPTLTPIVDGDNQAGGNMTLGWQSGNDHTMRPRGVTIGWMTKVKTAPPEGGPAVQTEIILLDRSAFNIAQKAYPERIQFGASATTAWKNVWDSGLAHPSYSERRPQSGVLIQVRTSATTRVGGIPVDLAGLFPVFDEIDEVSKVKSDGKSK